MASEKSLLQRIRWEATKEFVANLVWSYWPIYGTPIVMAALAYLGGYPLAIIFLFCLGALALIAVTLNQLSEWQDRRSPAGKLDFGPPVIGIRNNDNKEGFPAVTGIKLGMGLVSKAQFPLEVEIENVETQIADKVPNERFFKRSVTLGINGSGQFTNSVIDLSKEITPNGKLTGSVKAKVRYGRPGNLKCETERLVYLAFQFDETGQLKHAEPSLTELKIE